MSSEFPSPQASSPSSSSNVDEMSAVLRQRTSQEMAAQSPTDSNGSKSAKSQTKQPKVPISLAEKKTIYKTIIFMLIPTVIVFAYGMILFINCIFIRNGLLSDEEAVILSANNLQKMFRNHILKTDHGTVEIGQLMAAVLSMWTSATMAVVGLVLRDTRLFTMNGLICIPLCTMLTIVSYADLFHVRTVSHSHIVVFADYYMVKLVNEYLEGSYALLLITEWCFFISSMLAPKYLNHSVRIHKIFLRKLISFQWFKWKEINKKFYKF